MPPPLRFLLNGPALAGAPVRSTDKADAVQAADAGAAPFGMGRMLFAGRPDTVVERILSFEASTWVGVINLVFSSGQTCPSDVRRSIELFGREVLPRIREGGPVVGNATSGGATA